MVELLWNIRRLNERWTQLCNTNCPNNKSNSTDKLSKIETFKFQPYTLRAKSKLALDIVIQP